MDISCGLTSSSTVPALRTVNSTLLTVSENLKKFSKSLEEIAKHINEQYGEIKDMFTAYYFLLTINEHSVNMNRETDEYRREYEILIDAVVNSQKGVIQLQLITPAQILEQVNLAKLIC